MNLHLMRFIDKYIGWIICVKLSAIAYCLRLFRKKISPDSRSVKNILVMKFWGIGSIILSTPLLKALRDKFPDSNIVFLTLTKNNEIVKLLEPVNQVITLDIDHGYFTFVASLLKSIFAMRKMKLDLVFDLEFFTRFSAIMTYLSGAEERIGFWAWEVWRGKMHTIEVPFNRYWHVKRNFYNLGVAIGIPVETNLKLLPPKLSIDEKTEMNTLLQKYNLKSKEYVCINPNAGELALSRKWLKENFIGLTSKILQKPINIKIVYLGSSGERSYTKSIVSLLNDPRIINSAGSLDIQQLIIILKNAKLLISNDSGPLHLAVALNTPTISFFGPETPVLYGHSDKNNIVFFKNIDCSPCMNVHKGKAFYCHKKSSLCLEEIKVDEVWREVEKFL